MKNRNSNLYNFKSVGVKLLDCDENSRRVKVYLSSFGNIDSDNDRIMKGAFAKSIIERGVDSTSNRKIAYLRMHDWNSQIGKFIELSEDDYGLLAVGQLGKSTKGQDALYDYQDGIIREHSIGFRYIQDKMKLNENEKCYDIFEVELWEGSAVTFGANAETMVIDVAKGLDKNSHLEVLNNEMNTLLKALKEGKGTDDRLYQIEMGLNIIQSKYNRLVSYEPTVVKEVTLKEDNNEQEELKKQILLKNKFY